MMEFENKGSRDQRGLGFEALDSRSTWSSFDDITWDDFGGADDHSVPDPDESVAPAWLPGRKRETRNTGPTVDIKEENLTELIRSKLGSYLEDTVAPIMDVDNWDTLNVADLGGVPDNLITENSIGPVIGNDLREESSEALLAGNVGLCIDEVYNEEDASAVTSSCHFPFSDVPTEAEIGLFGGENDADKGGTLLEYTWGNLEDMDNLFQNEDSPFGQGTSDTLLQWPSSSSSPESSAAVVATTSELRALKGKAHDQDLKMEFIPCDSFEKSKELCSNNTEHELDVLPATQELARLSHEGDSDKMSDVTEDPIELSAAHKEKDSKVRLPIDVDKAYPAKRQAVNPKRNDHRTKKQIYQKKLSMENTKQQPLPLQLKPTVASTLQVYPQVVAPSMLGVNPSMQQRSQQLSYMHSSFGSVHHSSYGQQQQAVMNYQHSVHHPPKQQYEQETREKLEFLTPPPVSGTNMTPQEKIEKLRWKQKMHRLASEQQQIAKQGISMDPFPPKQQLTKQGKLLASQVKPDAELILGSGSGSSSATVKLEDGEGTMVEAAVLNQLLSIMCKLEVGTRICIRDALYRLARSAMYRHASDGFSSSEGSNNSANAASEKDIPRSFRYPMLETETNPIDRTIANLLFHKRHTSVNTESTVAMPSSLTCLESQSPWIWQHSGVSQSGDRATTSGEVGLPVSASTAAAQQQQQESFLAIPDQGACFPNSIIASGDRESEGSGIPNMKLKSLTVDKVAKGTSEGKAKHAVGGSSKKDTSRVSVKREATNEFLVSHRGKNSSNDLKDGGSSKDAGS